MKKIDTKYVLNITTYLALLAVPFLKFFSKILQMYGILETYDSINPAVILYAIVPFLIFIYVYDIKVNKRKLDIYDYLLFILILTGLISVMFSINKYIAIFGKYYRHEGFLSILSYYFIFINWKNYGTKEDIRKFIKLIVIIGIINSIYALFQMYTNFDFILIYKDNGKMASGLCVNPNFFGSLIVTVLSIVTCKFLINKKMSFKLILLIILFFISLINCESTGPFLTYIILLLFLVIFLYKKKYQALKNFLILCSILILTYISIYFINTNFAYDNDGKLNNKCETCASSLKVTILNGGNGRLKIWKNSLDIVKDNFIVGVGFDNFYFAYPNLKIDNSLKLVVTNNSLEKENAAKYIVYDNAHNVYLHTLVSTGILGLIPYLLLCLLVFIKGLKSNDKLIILLLAGFVAYSIQAFSNISVIQVAPIYYVIMGLMLVNEKEYNRKLEK